jgi:hypothetical protein
MLNHQEFRQMLLAGTVTFPATFPQLGRLRLATNACDGVEILSVEENPSPRVTLKRHVKLSSVRAIFIPNDPRCVRYNDGEWLTGCDLACQLHCRLDSCDAELFGIVFVPETEPSLLQVSAGMTAAESIQYYPPLPGDPSHNHYNAWPKANTNTGSRLPECGLGAGSCANGESEPAYGQLGCSCTDIDSQCEELILSAMASRSMFDACSGYDSSFPSNDLPS